MQKLILSLLVGLFSPTSEKPTTLSAPASLQPVAFAQPQVDREALKLALSVPPVSLDEAVRNRAEVRHEKNATGNGRSHRFIFPGGSAVEFTDRARRSRDQARRDWVVMHGGAERASAEPDSTFAAAGRAAGLTPQSIEALRFVSRHEGGFDAINTWDRARFSWGFIQFAGGRGFPPALAHFKATSPELFRKLLGDYGVDVLPGENGRPEPVYVEPDSGKLIRGAAAEQAYGDDPLVVALFIRAGRVPEVKQRQVEAAIRDYALPALVDTFQDVRVSDILRSQQGLAMLIDRKVHEGNVRRLEASLEHASIISNRRNPEDWPALEGLVLDLAVRDADARSNIVELANAAAAMLDRASSGAQNGQMAFVPNGPSLTAARAALEKAVYEADYRMVVSNRRDEMHHGFASALAACTPDQMRAVDAGTAAAVLSRSAANVRELVSGLRFEYAIRNRLRDIRGSQLPGPARQALDYP
ncbi:MAG: hypothetical protein ACO1SX_04025 [Actinomycetota bacterium]